MDIDGSTVVMVTGGASGLGEATVRRFVGAGARVLVADRDATKGAALASELGATFALTDVTDAASVQSAIDAACALGALRVVVHCAGIGWASRTLAKDGSPHDLGVFEQVIRVNLLGTFGVLRLAAAAMAKGAPNADGERGVIVNTASVAAFDGQIGQAAYAASKAGVVGLTLPVARDLAAVGIRVCTIAPGTFDTPMLAMLPEPARAALAAGIPFPRRLGSPAEYAALAEHIARNAYLNGETIRLDGALRMPPK
ncbi:MAG: SDR family NAD(P)-dependent oxidoreductase [Deltaproteobacteria bacterium]|nr:SDR family NAD(P)-dependent oxidoreductase [Deltaproteobacteria bacterium]